jgi:hypothetical protein
MTIDLGTIRAGANHDIPVTVYDPDPRAGPLTYALISGSLPPGLNLDSNSGYIWGYVDYQPQYLLNYSFEIQSTKTYTIANTQTQTINSYSLTVEGNIQSQLVWITDSNLGSIETGAVSELSVEAKETDSSYNVRYNLISGNLPLGLNLLEDGSIAGRAAYGSTGTYTFTIVASDPYVYHTVSQTFTLEVIEPSIFYYTEIYCRPFLIPQKRKDYQNFITDMTIFDPKLIYRFNDTNFGVQNSIRMILEFGIENLPLDDYMQALEENFYRRRFLFGDVKTAIAQDSTGNTVYEVIYVDVVDRSAGINPAIYAGNNIYYPASVDNMRRQLSLIELPNQSLISIDDNLQPRFIQTTQPGSTEPVGYIRSIILCYALPGKSQTIIRKIQRSGFDFKLFDFEVDRLIVGNSVNGSLDKYLLIGRQNITDILGTDDILYEGAVIWEFDDNVILTRT